MTTWFLTDDDVGVMRLALAVGAAVATSVCVPAMSAAGSFPPPVQRVTVTGSENLAARFGLGSMIGFRALYRDLAARHDDFVRQVWVGYRAWNGKRREAVLVLPDWYGPKLDPPIPLVISPHGRGGTARGNARLWGDLPAFGPFAVVNPEGQGRRLTKFSWGWRGQIDDLARMPAILEHALPWLRIERHGIYAVGSSMGGQETLLLDALHPRLLAGAVALDSATNMAARYRAFATLPDGAGLQQRMRVEIGGTPTSAPGAYAARSPLAYARVLATDGVPLSIWWSTHDEVVRDQRMESGLLYHEIEQINPRAPVSEYVGSWAHSAEMRPLAQLPLALVELGIIRVDGPLPGLPATSGSVGGGRLPPSATLLVPVEIPSEVPTLDGAPRAILSAALRIPRGVVRVLSRLAPEPQTALLGQLGTPAPPPGPSGERDHAGAPSSGGV